MENQVIVFKVMPFHFHSQVGPEKFTYGKLIVLTINTLVS